MKELRIMDMKKMISLVLIGLMAIGTASAAPCIKSKESKSQESGVRSQDLTILVMDSTKALIPNAEIKIGKTTFRTSWDGRIVLRPEQLKGLNELTVACEGYEWAKVKSDELRSPNSILIVSLQAKPDSKKHKDKDLYYTLGTRSKSTGVLYRPAEVGSDGAVPMPEVEPAYVEEAAYAATDMVADKKGGKLTAGEVNDFAKWTLWPSILDSTHQRFIPNWRLSARRRYTVQVTNQAGFPLASQSVSLLDAKGNTLFQAVTDNTGKAELWYSLILPLDGLQVTGDGLQVTGDGLKIRVDNQTIAAKEWREGLNTIVLDDACQTSSDVDVVFVFDATGSMGDELRYLNAEMQDVISRATSATGGLSIRTGAVVYRDHGDEYITRLSRLTNDLETTKSFIGAQHASGGGDFPEAIPEALMAACNSAGWNESARARIAFLVLDAPCHQDSATLALLHEQLLNASALGIRVVPVVCSGMDESGELLMRSMALATNGTSFFLTDDSGIGHTHLKPTTDTLKVEHLNDMLVRTIVEFSKMPSCDIAALTDAPEENDQFIPNPFAAKDIEANPNIPHGEGIHYLVDVSGKLISISEGEVTTTGLPIGVYFIKTFIDGQWYTQKILVR